MHRAVTGAMSLAVEPACIPAGKTQSYSISLAQALLAILQWQTRVHVCVITDGPDQLENVFHDWALPNVHVCRYSSALEDEQYAIVWKHREIFENALRSGAVHDCAAKWYADAVPPAAMQCSSAT